MEGVKQATTNFSFSFYTWVRPKKSTPGKLAYITYFQQIEINATKLEKTPIHF